MLYLLPVNQELEERRGGIFYVARKSCFPVEHKVDPDYRHITNLLCYDEMLEYGMRCRARLGSFSGSDSSDSTQSTPLGSRLALQRREPSEFEFEEKS